MPLLPLLAPPPGTWTHANLKGKFDASAITGLTSGDPVTTWTDDTGTSTMTQATVSAQPTYQAAVRAGKAVVRFDSTSDYMESAARRATSMTLALVRAVSGTGTLVQMWNGSTLTGAGPIIISGNRGVYVRSVSIPTDGAHVADAWERWIIVLGPGKTDLYVNGTQVITNTSTMNEVVAASSYARLGGSDGAPEFFSGGMDLAEAHIYDAALTGSDITALDTYLADKWGFTSTSAGTATGSLSFTGTATGARTPKASATGSLAFAGTAVGKRTPKASSSGTVTFTGTASGTTVRRGTGTGTLAFTGTATGKRTPKATSNGTLAFVGTATGSRTPKATGSGSLTFTGSASGTAPIAGQSSGSATGSLTFTGTAVGNRSPKGGGTGTLAFAGTAIGKRQPVASSGGTLVLTGIATGVRQPVATAVGSLVFVGTAAGTSVIVPAPPERTTTVALEVRVLVIASETRRTVVAAESRTQTIPTETRTTTVGPETRTLEA